MAQSCEKKINHELFQVNENEFTEIKHEEYFNLKLVSELGTFERIVSLLNELSILSINSCIFLERAMADIFP